MRRGLKRAIVIRDEYRREGERWNDFPDAKGIETFSKVGACDGTYCRWKDFPDAKGIETLS
jgi:hypothetical protein